MQTDEMLQSDVLEELRLEPSVDSSQIGVTASNGVVTLTGFVPSYAQKHAAEEAAKRVYGVRGVAADIEVRISSEHQRKDADIARTAISAMEWDSMVPDRNVKVTVDKGWLTLEGAVDWRYQRDAAERVVRNLTGVRGVSNLITLKAKAKVNPAEVRREILEAFRRNADLEARRIGVDSKDGQIILHGNVHNWSELSEAARAAASVPGVGEVLNRLEVVP